MQPSGLIEQGNLTAFTGAFQKITNNPVFTLGLNSLELFSFDTIGGVSSLDIAANGAENSTLCVGAATNLSASCTGGLTFPSGTVGVSLLDNIPLGITLSLPVITLASSVTTPVPAREPSSLALLASALGILGLGAIFCRRPRSAS